MKDTKYRTLYRYAKDLFSLLEVSLGLLVVVFLAS